jgi:hypothetical protein
MQREMSPDAEAAPDAVKIIAASIYFPMRSHSVGCGNTQIPHAIGYAKFRSRLHHTVIRVYDEAPAT